MTTFSTGIKDSSSIKSMAVMSIFVLLSSLYLSFISNNSAFIIANTFSSDSRIDLYSLIFSNNSANSFSILDLSKPVNLRNFISKIALA